MEITSNYQSSLNSGQLPIRLALAEQQLGFYVNDTSSMSGTGLRGCWSQEIRAGTDNILPYRIIWITYIHMCTRQHVSTLTAIVCCQGAQNYN